MNRQKGRVALRLLAVVIGAFVLAGVFMAAGRLLAAHIPWISIESPESGEVVSGIIPVSCEYGINGGSMHTLKLYAGGAEADRIRVGGRLGSHTFFLDTSDYSDGPIQISIRAYSAAPPSSHYSTATVNAIIENAAGDEEPPEIDILSPDSGELFPASSVVLSASLIDDVAVDPETVVVKLDDANITAQCDVSALSVFCSLSPEDGSHTSTIDCADTSGNAAPRASVSFVVDATPPALALTSHENGQVVTTPTITVSGTASDATSGVASVEVNGEAATISGGAWTMPGVSLDEGANAISVTAEDAAGHVANYILIINYDAPDTSKPVITIEEPTAGALFDAAPVVLSAELEDNEAVATATVVVKLNGADVTAGCAVSPFSVICPLSPADGTQSATIDCKDTSNNAAVQKSVSFTLDTAPPVVSVTSHADGQVVIEPVITLSGSASDAISGVSAVEVNGEAAALSGGAWTFAGAALDEGLNAFVVSAQDAAGHSAVTSLTINYVIPECLNDADCDDADARTEDVCLNPGTAGAVCVHNGIECLNDADCDDDDVLTLDTCVSPGTAQSSCVNATIECASDADCDDADALTIDVCENPSSASSLCVNTAIACNTDADCDDDDSYTQDTCLNPGTVQSLCSSIAIECLSSTDCDDADARTEDVCLNPGTAGAVCVHNGIECLNDEDCDDDDVLTLDTCVSPGTAQSSCVNAPIECATDADCDDADALTIDVCENPSSASSLCVNTAIACNTDSDCDDDDSYTLDSCLNPGAIQSLCSSIAIECLSSADCDDADARTEDVCLNPGTAGAVCVHNGIECLNDADCDDDDAYTLDSCVAAGTTDAECAHTPIACLNDSDCDDDNAYTIDDCAAAGTAEAACTHVVVACLTDSDCDDENALTIDTCSAPGTAQSACVNTAIVCNTDADCDDGNAYTINTCVNGGAANAECVIATIVCLSAADCDDDNPYTFDTCFAAGTADAACSHAVVACLTDSDCDDSNPLTLDTCLSSGTEQSSCVNDPLECASDADCDDGNPLTISECVNPGSTQSSCTHTAIACNVDADCDDRNDYTEDVCIDGGTTASSCLHNPISCLNSSDCDDEDALTIDECLNPGMAQSSCSHTQIACNTDADCDDENEYTINTCMNGGSLNAECVIATIACLADTDCDDGNALTIDMCVESGTAQSGCVNTAIACNMDADCDDGNEYTINTCVNGSAANAECVIATIACLTNSDCNDDDAYTLDSCGSAGTADSACSYVSIACLSDTDCDDDNALTIDTCLSAGAAQSACVNTAIACNTDADCDDENAYTLDTCAAAGTAEAACSHAAVACNTDSDCDDGNPLTISECLNPGMAQSSCAHTPIACNTDADCDDENEYTINTCVNGGALNAECIVETIDCLSDADCNDDNAYTLDTCAAAGTAEAECSYASIECLTDTDCDDDNALTIDACLAPGTAQSSCAHTPIACNTDADCDDENEYTINTCVNGGALNAECIVATIACLSDADCNDDDERTFDYCVSAGMSGAECSHTPIACLNDADCDDDNPYTIDACAAAGTSDAACSHAAVACITDSDCDDSNPLTLDACVNAGLAESVCSNVACEVACETDADCDDGDPLTVGACENAGTCDASCAQTEIVPEPEEPAQLTLTIVAPVNGHITNSLALTVNGEATIGATVSVNGTAAAVGEDGAFSAVLNLEEGANIIIASATLADDTITKEVEITADTTPPSVISVAPDDGALFEISPDRIAVRVEDNPGGVGLNSASVRLFLDGEELVSQYVATSGAHEASPGAMPSGRRIVTMTAFDLAGNSIEWAGSFVVAGRGPKITIKKLPGWVDGARGFAVAPVQYSDDESVPSDEQQEPVEELATMQSLASPSSPFSAIASSSSVNIEAMLALLRARNQEVGIPWKFPEVADAIAAEYEQRGTLPDELPDAPALKGTMEALVEETDAPLDIESIEAIVDGRPVESEYDAQTKTLTASLEGFAPGEYEATFTASDIDGNETMTMETFNLTYSVDALMLENVTSPGDQISFGDTFRIRLDSSYDGLYTPWATLYSTDNTTVYPGGVGPCYGSHFVTSGFNLQHIEGTEYSYEAQGPLYTTLDLDGNEASRLIAVTLMSAYNYELGEGECLYSSTSMEVVGGGAPQITSGSINNVNYPEWKTVAVGESARIEVEATPGSALECVIAAGLFTSDGEPSILTTSQMIETQQGVYVCEAVIDSRPDVEGESAHFVLAVIQSHGAMLSIIDDFLTYRENINEVHFRNISRTGASDIAPGEMFEITAAGVSGMTELPALILDMAVFSSNIDGPFQFASPLVEVSPGSGEYRIEATLDVVPEGVTAIRAAVGHPDTSVKPALSTEFLTVIPFAPAAPTLITHIDGVEVQEGAASSDNFEPVVAGTTEPNSTINIYKFIEGGGAEVHPVAGGPALSAIFAPDSLGYYSNNFDNGNDGYWSSWGTNCIETEFTEDVLRLEPGPGGDCVQGTNYIRDVVTPPSEYFKLETDFRLTISDSSGMANINGSYVIAFDIDNNNDERLSVSLSWDIGIENSEPKTSVLTLKREDAVICQRSMTSPGLDAWRHIAIEYISEGDQAEYGLYIDGALAQTCSGPAGLDGIIVGPRMEVTAGSDSDLFTVDIDNFLTTYKVPAGYEISGPALSLGGVSYSDMGENGLYIGTSGALMTGPQPLPQHDPFVTGEADIIFALITVFDVGSPEDGLTPEAKATIYTNGDIAYLTAFFDQIVTAGNIGGYRIDGYGVALRAPAAGAPDPYAPASPILSQEQACSQQPGAPGWLRWDTASQKYLASRTPLENNGIQFADYVIWGLTESGEGGFIVNQDDTPVWWADGEENISAATIEFFDGNRNVNATVFGVASFINDLPNMGVTVHAVAHDILIAPNDPKGVNTPGNPEDDHYTWNQSAIAAAGIGLAPARTCVGGLFELIGTTTSDPEGAFSALVTVPFTAPGDHIILARSFNPQTGALISQSPTVTYHINESGDIACDTDADCDDGIALTLDACADPGTIQSACLHTQIACNTDADCDDENAYTINTCVNGGALNAECAVASIACLSDSDCNDENAYTIDSCVFPGTAEAACSHASIACLADADCDDGIALTIDACVDPGTSQSACSHTEIIPADTTPPIILFIEPDEMEFTRNPQPVVKARIYDDPGGSGLASVSWASPGYPFVATNVGDDIYHITFNQYPGGLPEGVNTITVIAFDEAGNSSTATLQWIVDKTPPAIFAERPAENGFTNDTLPVIAAYVTDNLAGVAPDSIYVLIDGAAAVNAQFDSETGMIEAQAEWPLANGNHTIYVEAADKSGNAGYKEWHFSIDTQPPAGNMNPIARPNSFTEVGEASASRTIYFTWDPIDDNNGGSGIETYYADIVYDNEPIERDAGIDGHDIDEADSDGLITYCIEAVDWAGNRSERQCDTITVATGIPAITNLANSPDPISPKNIVSGENTNDYTTITADIAGTDPSYTWVARIYDGDNELMAELPLEGPGQGVEISAEWHGKRYPEEVYVDDGLYHYKVVATSDLSGQTSLPGVGAITVDNTYPESVIAAPPAGANIKDDYYQVIIGVYEEIGIETVVFMVDGASRGDATYVATSPDGARIYVFNWNVAAENPGNHGIAALATDKARNAKSSPTVNVKMGQMPVPEVAIISPDSNFPSKDELPVEVEFSLQQGKVQSIELLISTDDVNYVVAQTHTYPNNAKPSSGTYTFMLDTAQYADGQCYLKARAIKNQSQSAVSEPVQMLIDNTPPVFASFTPQNGGIVALNFSETANTTFIVAINETGSGLPSTAKLTLNGAPYTMRIYNSNAICSSSLGAACPSGLPAGDYYATIEVTDIAGNTASAEWIFYVRKQPELRVSCGISGAPGDEILLSATNFPPNVEDFKIFLRQRTSSSINPTILSYEMEILEYDGAIIRTKTPDGVPPSDPFSPHGLPYIQAEMKGAYAGISVVSQGNNPFQVLQYPIDRDNVIYVANSESRDISIIDLTQGVSVATINSSYGLHAGGNHISQGRLSDIAMSHDGKYVYTLVGGEDIPEQYRKMSVIDTACNTVVSTIDNVWGYNLLLSPKSGILYAFYSSGIQWDLLVTGAHVLDYSKAVTAPDAALVGTVPIISGFKNTLTMDAREIIVSLSKNYKVDETLIAYDPHNAVISRIAPSSYSGFAETHSVTPDGRYIVAYWSSDEEDDSIFVFDIKTGETIASYHISAVNLIKIHPEGKYVYVIKKDETNLAVLDLGAIITKNAGNETVFQEQLPSRAKNLYFSNDGSKAFILLDDTNVQQYQMLEVYADSMMVISHQETIRRQLIVEADDQITTGNSPRAAAFQPRKKPEIFSVMPSAGHIGDVITITGVNFCPIPDHNIVMFEEGRGTVLDASDTELTVRVPFDGESGQIYVACLQTVSNHATFTMLSPNILNISSAEINLGQIIEITGEGFSEIASENKVFFNGILSEVIFSDRRSISVQVPINVISGSLYVVVYGKQSNLVEYAVITPTLQIVSPANETTFTMSDDVDGNAANGIQINFLVSSPNIPIGSAIVLSVNGKYLSSQLLDENRNASFNNVTVLPPQTIIKAYFTDENSKLYSEDIIEVLVDSPTNNTSLIAYQKYAIKELDGNATCLTSNIYVHDLSVGVSTLMEDTFNGSHPSWRSDGNKIVFARTEALQGGNNDCYDMLFSPSYLYIVNVNGGNVYPLNQRGSSESVAIQGFAPSWSPDGTKIAYFHKEKYDTVSDYLNSNTQLSVVNVDAQGRVTSGPHLIASNIRQYTFDNILYNKSTLRAVWSPNSSYLLFSGATNLPYGMAHAAIREEWRTDKHCAFNTSEVSCNFALTEGVQSISFAGYDIYGRAIKRKNAKFMIDVTVPRITVDSHYDKQIVKEKEINIYGTVLDDTNVTVSVNGQIAALYGINFIVNALTLNEGLNTITFVAVDEAGNTETKELEVLYEPESDNSIDAWLVNITNGDILNTAIEPLTIMIDNNAGSIDTDTIQIFINGIPIPCDVIVDQTIAIVCPEQAFAYNDIYKIVVKAGINDNPIQAKKEFFFVIDTKSPHIHVESHTENEVIVSDIVSMWGITEDTLSGLLSLSINGEEAVIHGNTWMVENIALNEGINYLNIEAVDYAGNTSYLIFMLDSNPLENENDALYYIQPAFGEVLNKGSVLLIASLSPEVDTNSIIIGNDNVSVNIFADTTGYLVYPYIWHREKNAVIVPRGIDIDSVDIESGIVSQIFSETVQRMGNLVTSVTSSPAGDRIAYVTANNSLAGDGYHLDVRSQNKTFIDDNIVALDWLVPEATIYNSTPPLIENVMPANRTYTARTSPIISATISDDQGKYMCGINSFKLIVDDVDVTHQAEYDWLTSRMTYQVSEGKYKNGDEVYFKIQAVDCVGNVSEWSETKFRIGHPPSFVSFTPEIDGATNAENVYVSATISNTIFDIASARLTINGSDVDAEYKNEEGILFTYQVLPEGIYFASAIIVDDIGYEVKSEWTFKVDRKSPTVSEIYPNGSQDIGEYRSIFTAIVSDGINGSGISFSNENNYVRLFHNEVITEHPLSISLLDVMENTARVYFQPPTFMEGDAAIAIAHVEDLAGNITSFTWIVTEEEVSRNINILHPVPNTMWNEPISELLVLAELEEDDEFIFMLNGEQCDYEKIAHNLFRCPTFLEPPDVGYETHNATVVINSIVGAIHETSWEFILTNSPSPEYVVPSIHQFTLNPNPINVTQDESVHISYRLTHDSKVTIRIHEIIEEAKTGDMIYTLVNESSESENMNLNIPPHEHLWNGLIETPQGIIKAQDGAYRISIEARLNDSSCNPNCLSSLLPDITTCELKIDEISKPVNVAPHSNKWGSIDYELNCPAIVSGIIGKSDGPVNHVLADSVVVEAGSQSFRWDGRVTDGLLLPEGQYQFALHFYPLMSNDVIVNVDKPIVSGVPERELVFNPVVDIPLPIEFNTNELVDMYVEIFDSNNFLIKTLSEGDPTPQGQQVLFWDGTDNDNNLVANAVYTMAIKAKNDDGIYSDPVYLAIQTQSPKLLISNNMVYVFGNIGDVLSGLSEDGIPLLEIQTETTSGLPMLKANKQHNEGVHEYAVQIKTLSGIEYVLTEMVNYEDD